LNKSKISLLSEHLDTVESSPLLVVLGMMMYRMCGLHSKVFAENKRDFCVCEILHVRLSPLELSPNCFAGCLLFNKE
jgi:hypothetical protein